MSIINKKSLFLILSVCLVYTLSMLNPSIANAGELNMTNEQNSKVSRFKARARVVNNKKLNNYFPETEDEEIAGVDEEKCGTVDIGNVKQNKVFNVPKEIDVIITGDVINTGNKCK